MSHLSPPSWLISLPLCSYMISPDQRPWKHRSELKRQAEHVIDKQWWASSLTSWPGNWIGMGTRVGAQHLQGHWPKVWTERQSWVLQEYVSPPIPWVILSRASWILQCGSEWNGIGEMSYCNKTLDHPPSSLKSNWLFGKKSSYHYQRHRQDASAQGLGEPRVSRVRVLTTCLKEPCDDWYCQLNQT